MIAQRPALPNRPNYSTSFASTKVLSLNGDNNNAKAMYEIERSKQNEEEAEVKVKRK